MKWPLDNRFNIEEHTILLGYRGSISHGTYIPSKKEGIDDKDTLGILVPPEKYLFGLSRFDQIEQKENEWDTVIYSVQKMFKLLLQSNPNVLCLLWLDDNDYIKVTELGKRIIENRDIFVTKQAYHSFSGYAYSKLSEITKNEFKGYMGEKRKQIVEKIGYDTKNASHLIRLLRMGYEFLTEGYLHVKRKDAPELIDIKLGRWPLEKVKEVADREFALVKEAYVRSTLPDKPDFERAEKLCINIIKDFYESKTQ